MNLNLINLLIAQQPLVGKQRRRGEYRLRRSISRSSVTSLKKLDRIARIHNGDALDSYPVKTRADRLRELRAERKADAAR